MLLNVYVPLLSVIPATCAPERERNHTAALTTFALRSSVTRPWIDVAFCAIAEIDIAKIASAIKRNLFILPPSSLHVHWGDSRRAADRMRIHENLQIEDLLQQFSSQHFVRRSDRNRAAVFQEHYARREFSRKI